MTHKVILLIVSAFYGISLTAQTFADGWEYVGVAVEEPAYTIWGSSPIMDDDGRVHLFVARWPKELKVDPGWRSHSEIAHYVSDKPEGPFVFSDVALSGRGAGHWDAFGAHNPAIHRVDSVYYLLYIANSNPNQPPHPANQHIGMAKSASLYGPWERVQGHGRILSPPDNPDYWNHRSGNGVNNPALLQHPAGGFFLYYKTNMGIMGLAIAENVEGPYVQMPFPVTINKQAIEDGYAFVMDEKICLLTTDNHGMIEKGGGILWTSSDGIRFTEAEKGFHRAHAYIDSSRLQQAQRHYGGDIIKFERPQVLLINDKPAYMYAPSGYHFFGKDATASYVLRRRDAGRDAGRNAQLVNGSGAWQSSVNSQHVRIISYNIWNGFDWGKDTVRQAALGGWLHDQQADVVALQELCGYNEARLKKEAAAWGHDHVVLLKESGYSVGLTSNEPIRVKEKMLDGLHHGALHAETHGIDFLVIHLHPGDHEFRAKEVEILMLKLDQIRRQTDDYMVLGDFNEQSPLDAEMYRPDNTFGDRRQAYYHVLARFMSNPLIDLVDKAGQALTERGSFPGLVLSQVQNESIESLRSRLERIDFMMASPRLAPRLHRAGVVRTSPTDWLSDHYPVVADLTR